VTGSANSDNTVVPDWPAPACVHALTTTRRLPGNSRPPYDAFNLGVHSGEDPATVQANRELLVRALHLPSPPRWLRQVHGDRSLRLGTEVLDGEPEADAAFTATPGVVLAILSADCLPLLLCADDGGEIAAIHAGWRGLAAGIVESCVRRLRTPPAKLMAWLGPAIGPASYEVGDDVRDAFMARDARAGACFAEIRPGHWSCDLYALAGQRLASAGIERIHGGGLDTFSDPRLYSFRRDGSDSGRMATLIWRTDEDHPAPGG